jgi:UDP-N-acetylglucosamine/UDP-N-acetylgalactosamine diphosphorylase
MPATPSAQLSPDLAARLQHAGQQHLARALERVPPADRAHLLRQIKALDLECLPALVRDYVKSKPAFALPEAVEPAPYYPRDSSSPRRPWDEQHFRALGENLLRSGKVAAFVVAGGQGSRLGFEGPKGCYPAGAVTGKPLFHVFADAILGAQDRYGSAANRLTIPWYIMTSPLNHDATVSFFETNHFFGLQRDQVMFFPQGVMPSLCISTGRVLLASPREIATNPDGHGGSLTALHASGALADMQRRGISDISYFQVDNPVVNLLDPVFLGLHSAAPDSSAQMSSKMVAKASASEKVGLFCAAGAGPRKGKIEIVEYSDLPMSYQQQTNPDGSLKFNAGSIAVHIISVAFVKQLNTDDGFSLPYHRAEKKIPGIDLDTFEPITPAASNGVKLERFVFDALQMVDKSIVYETDRTDEFAPIKNADEPHAVASDSPTSCRLIQTRRAARWLEHVGVAIPRSPAGDPDCIIELSPRTASCAHDLASTHVKLPKAIDRGARIAL